MILKEKLLIVVMFLALTGYSQYDYEFGYWESGFWKKFIHVADDSNKVITVLYKNDSIRYTGEIKNGLPVGTWKYYNEFGNLLRSSEYTGDFIEYDNYSQNKKRITGTYQNGVAVGIWSEYITSCFDSSYIYKSYDCSTDSVKKFIYHYLFDSLQTLCDYSSIRKLDTVISSKSKHKYIKELSSANTYFSIDFGVGEKKLNFNQLNRQFSQNLQQTFSIPPTYFNIGITIGKPNQQAFYLNLNTALSDSVKTDSINYRLRSGSGFVCAFGYDVVKKDFLDLIPFVGIGNQNVKLTYMRNANYYQDTLTISSLFNNIPTTNAAADPFNSIDYVSRNFIFDIGIDLRFKIPLSKYINTGIYIGGKYGYKFATTNGSWSYDVREVYKERQEANFIPRTNVSGDYWFVSIGYYSAF